MTYNEHIPSSEVPDPLRAIEMDLLRPGDADVTDVFNRLLIMNPERMRGIIDIRRAGRANDMYVILHGARIDGSSLTEWHIEQEHFASTAAQLHYAAGKIWGTQVYTELYKRVHHRRLQPDTSDSVDAYRVAQATLAHSYEDLADIGLSRWSQEHYRERQFLGTRHLAQVNTLLYEKLQRAYRKEPIVEGELPEAFYTGMVDASIFMNAYIRWKDYGAAPLKKQRMGYWGQFPYAPGGLDVQHATSIVTSTQQLDHLPTRLEAPLRPITSVADFYPKPGPYRWARVDSTMRQLPYSPDDRQYAGAAQTSYAAHVLTRSIPQQTNVDQFRWEHDFLAVMPAPDHHPRLSVDDLTTQTIETVLCQGELRDATIQRVRNVIGKIIVMSRQQELDATAIADLDGLSAEVWRRDGAFFGHSSLDQF